MFGFKHDVKKELNELWTEIHKLQNFQTKIENAVPTFNKMYEKVKQLDELCASLLILAEKMDKKIKQLENKPTTKRK